MAGYARGSDGGPALQVIGGPKDRDEHDMVETMVNLRLWFNNTLHGDTTALEEAIRPDAARAFLAVEEKRSALREDFPNRFAILKIKNTGKKNIQDLTIELVIGQHLLHGNPLTNRIVFGSLHLGRVGIDLVIITRIRRMTRQFDVALRQIICNNQDVSPSLMEQSWRTRRVNRSMTL